MYDQSFCARTLERTLRKSDFRRIPAKDQKAAKAARIEEALSHAKTCLAPPYSAPLLSSFLLKGKVVFKIESPARELAIRKACYNLERITRPQNKGRSQITSCLNLLLREGVPYTIYRLDISNFYESLNHADVISKISNINRLSPQSKIIISNVLKYHNKMGGTGVPRGLSMSALLANLMMGDFDSILSNTPGVFFYSRYVDDIVIVTSGQEEENLFLDHIESLLPKGLTLNDKKKQISHAKNQVKPIDSKIELFRFDYLGYSYTTFEPKPQKAKQHGTHERSVIVDIAASKIRKIKTRIAKSFLDYAKTKNWELLLDRIKFLTQNFSVYNAKAGGKKLAGIFHSYPQVSLESKGLNELDDFLRHATLSKTGRIFSQSSKLLSSNKRKILLSHSFVDGHKNRIFVHFSATRISTIQKCWLY